MAAKHNKFGFMNHKKMSALVVSLAIHSALILVALSFVAVSVVCKEEARFEPKPVQRPKMQLRKLQVPVNVKKKKMQKPKLRKRIVVQPKLNQTMPDIKMPEITGVKGGLGAAGGSGLGRAGSIGFAMPEINFFGVKGKSEKIMIILDGDQYMAADELGGAYGFEVIKKECLKLIEGLPPTALFNIVVYGRTHMLFPSMVSASSENVQQARDWLMPLNEVKGVRTRYGVDTLGPGGSQSEGDYSFGKFSQEPFRLKYWNESVMLAMQQQADMVFLLTGEWGFFGFDLEDSGELRKQWNQTSAGKNWAEKVKKGRKLLDEDNAKRKAAGEPPRALNRGSERDVVRAYFSGTPEPPAGERVYLSEKDLADAFKHASKNFSKEVSTYGLKKKKATPTFSLNVIFFKPEKYKDETAQKFGERDIESFKEFAQRMNGEFREVVGLEAIKSYATPASQ